RDSGNQRNRESRGNSRDPGQPPPGRRRSLPTSPHPPPFINPCQITRKRKNPGRIVSQGSLLTGRLLSSVAGFLAPRVGLEPTTFRLTAGCSTIELPRN